MPNSNQVDTGSAVNSGLQIVPLNESFGPYAFDISKSFELAKLRGEYEYTIADPCNPGTVREIDTTLRNFFSFLKGLKEEGGQFINETLGEAQNLTYEISKTVSKISGVLRTFTQRLRNFVIGLIKELIQGAIQCLLTPLLDQIKDTVIGAVLDQLMCKFDEIMNSLKDLVSDFLLSLINLSLVNPALCAVESLVNGLLNNLADTIDNAIQPILSQIGDLLGGAAQVVGSVFSVVNTILGYEGMLCSEPKCPGELKSFKTGAWGGSQKGAEENFSKFKPSSAVKGFNDSVDKWLNEVFPENSNNPGSSCYTGPYECGSPQIVFFGGGGSGASASAVVNGIGQIIGVNLLSGGKGYKTRPFVSIVDPAGCGSNAAAYAITNDDGEVIKVVLTNPGYEYSSTDLGGVPVINYFTGTPNPVQVGNSITLKWDVSNFSSLSLGIEGFNDLQTSSASFVIDENDVTFTPGSEYTTKTYTLTATKLNENSTPQQASRTFTFTVYKSEVVDQATDKPIDSFSDPVIDKFVGNPGAGTTLSKGNFVTLSWNTTNVDQVEIITPTTKYSKLDPDGSVTVSIPDDITTDQYYSYKIEATSTKKSKTVTDVLDYKVSVVASSVSVETTSLTPQITPPSATSVPLIDSFTGNPNVGSILQSESTLTLSWQTTNADIVKLTPTPPDNPTLLPDGTVSVVVPKVLTDSSVTYELTAINSSNDASVSKSLTYSVLPSEVTSDQGDTSLTYSPTIVNFTGNPDTSTIVSPGSLITFNWETKHADQIKISPAPVGNPTLPTSGSVSYVVSSNITSDTQISYQLTATNTNTGETVSKTLSYVVKMETTPSGQLINPPSISPLEPESPVDQVIGVIDQIIILEGGIDYNSSEDQISIIDGLGNNNGAQISMTVTSIGQIIGIQILNPGYGFTTIPEVQINSKNGVGAKFLPQLRFIPINQFLTEQKLKSIDPTKLVKVIDCVYN